MDTEKLKRIITDQEEDMAEKFKRENIIPREKITCSPKVDIATVITGPRRAGKSIFSFHSIKNQPYAYINFDDERLNLKTSDLNDVLEAFYSLKGAPEVFLFDEIQNVAGWEKFISRIIKTKKVIITGSNANLLSSELSTHLAGRHKDIVLMPFSFREFLQFKNFNYNIYSTKSISKIKSLLFEYMQKGGFPLALKLNPSHLIELFSDILEKDILLRYKPRHASAVREMSKLLIANPGSEITYNKLKNILKIESVHTVQKYMGYFESAYLVFKLNRFSYKLKEQVSSPKKVYSIDTGLLNAVAFSTSPNHGKLMENLIAIELFRRKSACPADKSFAELCSAQTIEPDLDFYYWRDYGNHEVDFVLKKGNKYELLQSCWDASNPLTMERKVSSLIKAAEELKTSKLTIVTWDEEKEITEAGFEITIIPLYKWLLR
ncbi:hypothetical protein AUJ17_03840 [Candidatus Micrarchaeota archaeon CG1_02_47_40]|nr:MAG: hypothetical protein AUJ17_03840 [Candidatus Micrarchaeota archaeon CG1_02_47_40]